MHGIKVKPPLLTSHSLQKQSSKIDKTEKILNHLCKKVKNSSLKIEKKAFHYALNQSVKKNLYQRRKMGNYRQPRADS